MPEEHLHTAEWGFIERVELAPDEFLREFIGYIKDRKVVSVGEFHDHNTDPTYSWLTDHQGEILYAYNLYTMYHQLHPQDPAPHLSQLLQRDSSLIQHLQDSRLDFHQLRKAHPGRLFAAGLLALARTQGFTDLILEGKLATDPTRHLEVSSDKAGDLLKLVSAMSLGLRLHSAYPNGFLHTAADVTDALFAKIVDVATTDAKVIVYNGMFHNMTVPFSSSHSVTEREGLLTKGVFTADQFTYGPRAIEKWGAKYGSIDLLSKQRPIENAGQISYMIEHATEGAITRYLHGKDQRTYILD